MYIWFYKNMYENNKGGYNPQKTLDNQMISLYIHMESCLIGLLSFFKVYMNNVFSVGEIMQTACWYWVISGCTQ